MISVADKLKRGYKKKGPVNREIGSAAAFIHGGIRWQRDYQNTKAPVLLKSIQQEAA